MGIGGWVMADPSDERWANIVRDYEQCSTIEHRSRQGTVFAMTPGEGDPTARTFRAGPVRIRISAGAPAPRERLSTDRIVEVALAQMKASGYDAVSMRSVARELGTGPASLYAHVASKDALDQLVVSRIAERLTIPEPDPDHWDDQVKTLLREMRDLYREHPGAARASLAMVPTEYGALRAAEALLALLRAGGIDDQAASWFCDLASLYVAAVAVEESIWMERDKAATRSGEPTGTEEEAMGDLRQFFATLPVEQFPLARAMAVPLTTGDGDRRFEFALDVLIAGVAAYSRSGGASE
jgi:AcrR family transcriptional regulator